MRRSFCTLVLLFIAFTSFSQAKITWQNGYKLSVLDFQAETPESQQGQSYYLAAALDFGNANTRQAFKQTKNPNKLVTTYFIPANSWLQQGEGTEIMLKYAQMEFDLLELYARKYRQQLHKDKAAFLTPDITRNIRHQVLAQIEKRRQEMQYAVAESEGKGTAFHEQLLQEIATLIEFCQECELTKK